MITADHHPRASTSDRAPTLGATLPDAAGTPTATVTVSRSRLHLAVDLSCAVLFVGLGAAAAFPLVWGLALHQAPLTVSAVSAELMCLAALLNRWFAPAAAKPRAVPFLAALEERPWVLITCLACAATSLATLITCWPGANG